ncbi:hypothetical protein [Marinomonas sp. 2405UD68-3]|uniref:hypothetical protein n=1 Tax=Marinomonas sp. 2405UD68-3 TaxID=3391835 RepID=UPI0039C95DAB
MDEQIKINFKDFYALVLWDPKLVNYENPKGISASFFFKCLYQLSKSSNRPETKTLLEKITKELTILVDAMQIERTAIKQKLPNACILNNPLTTKPKTVVINSEDSLCKSNALLLRTIVTFDNLLHLIYQSYLLNCAKQKEYYKLRRHWGRRIRFILETGFFELRQLHKEW